MINWDEKQFRWIGLWLELTLLESRWCRQMKFPFPGKKQFSFPPKIDSDRNCPGRLNRSFRFRRSLFWQCADAICLEALVQCICFVIKAQCDTCDSCNTCFTCDTCAAILALRYLLYLRCDRDTFFYFHFEACGMSRGFVTCCESFELG